LTDYSGNHYTNGQICLIPYSGGAVNYSTSIANNSDAAFDVGLAISTVPGPSQPTYTPNVTPIYAGTQITLNEDSTGPEPLYYEWLSDGGTGGNLTPVSGFTTSPSLAVDTTAFTP